MPGLKCAQPVLTMTIPLSNVRPHDTIFRSSVDWQQIQRKISPLRHLPGRSAWQVCFYPRYPTTLTLIGKFIGCNPSNRRVASYRRSPKESQQNAEPPLRTILNVSPPKD
jgi:hypothetical protein